MRVADDAPVPDGQPVIVSAARFLAEAETLARRTAPTGVVWPNNRPVAELAPYLPQLALVALVFPIVPRRPGLQPGAAPARAPRLRGELRATGKVLRDQFLFLLRAGFDSFEVSKDADAAAFAESIARYDVFYQPTADGRTTAACARLDRAADGDLCTLSPDDRGAPTGS